MDQKYIYLYQANIDENNTKIMKSFTRECKKTIEKIKIIYISS